MQCEIRTPGRRSHYRTSCGQETWNFVKRVWEITKLVGPAALFSTSQKEDGPEKERGEWRTGERGYLSLQEYKGIPFPEVHFLILSCLCWENREDPESRVACHGTRTAGFMARFRRFTLRRPSLRIDQRRNFRKGSWKESVPTIVVQRIAKSWFTEICFQSFKPSRNSPFIVPFA